MSKKKRLSPPSRFTVVFLAAFDVGPPHFGSSSLPFLLDSALFFVFFLSGSRRPWASRIVDLLFITFLFSVS